MAVMTLAPCLAVDIQDRVLVIVAADQQDPGPLLSLERDDHP